jgi:SAM-dependent methyltransferase
VELGSGIGKIKSIIPSCICTDLFPNPWIDQVENAYDLSFQNSSISNLILFDVFHHLKYPGNALDELNRVLKPNGRLIIFEPSISLLGRLIFGLFHKEPIGRLKNIQWNAAGDFKPDKIDYYAAQGNAGFVFNTNRFAHELESWEVIYKKRLSALAYIASGGFSGKAFYPVSFYHLIKKTETILDAFPKVFSTRILIILRKMV